MRLIPGSGIALRRRSVFLAPCRPRTTCLPLWKVDAALHHRLLAGAQKLRGRIALQEGAIQDSQLSADGRHIQPVDEHSWHLLTLDEEGRVAACTRYLRHSNTVSFPELTVSHSALATSESWGRMFQHAIEADLALVSKRNWSYVEMGGWVISEKLRCTSEALRMVLTAYGLAQLLGGALGISTVTTRHGSSSILRRIGGEPVLVRGKELPCYYEPQYHCEMEILRFDSSRPSSRYSPWVDECRSHLQTVPVICAKSAGKSLGEIAFAANSWPHIEGTSKEGTSNEGTSKVDAISSNDARWVRSAGVA